jgi:hypothetical protein
MNDTQAFKHDVAISFAGEDRDVAEAIVRELDARGINYFYDDEHRSELWGENLYDRLSDLYQHDARFALVLVSRHYVRKRWTKHERQAIQARAFEQDGAYLLPVKLDNSKLEGLLRTVAYLPWEDNPDDIADLIGQKLQKPAPVAPEAPEPQEKQPPMVENAGLPSTTSELFGRSGELAMLDGFWESPRTNIAVLVAWGGVGKTNRPRRTGSSTRGCGGSGTRTLKKGTSHRKPRGWPGLSSAGKPC